MNVPGADRVFGSRGAPPPIDEGGKVMVRPLPIINIVPDLRQPRRAVPAAVRGQWDGDPNDVPTVLANWHAIVEERLEQELDLPTLLRAEGDADDLKHDDPVVESYLELIRLGASIYRDGLVNAIRVARNGVRYVIESGERRWLAHHLLSLHVSGDFSTVPAIERSKIDVWAQAAENGARRPLNAIGMARQLALLIMAMYEHEDGVSFEAYDRMVLPGECDRKFYAQVANGNVFRIKRGMGERVIAVTGLSSIEQISQYRALLAIPDTLWVKADEQNWTENAIREYVRAVKATEETRDTLTPVKVSTSSVTPPVSGLKAGDRVRTADGIEATVDYVAGKVAFLRGVGGRNLDTLTRLDGLPAEAEALPALDALFPLNSHVYHPHKDAVGKVGSYDWNDRLLLVADVALPDSQTMVLWAAADVRAATDDEVTAYTVQHPRSPGLDDADGAPPLGIDSVLYHLYSLQSESGDWVPLMQFEHAAYTHLATCLTSGLAVELLRVTPSGGLAKWYQITSEGCERLGLNALPTIPEPPTEQYPGRTPAAQASANPFSVGDRVSVRGAPGTIRYLKGERCGVYSDATHVTHYYHYSIVERLEDESPAPAPAPLYSDTATPAAAQPALPTTALLEEFANVTEVGDVLRFLKRQRNASPALEVTLQELLTVSKADIAQYLEQAPERDVWRLYLEDAAAQILDEMNRLGTVINDYLRFLHVAGEALRGE